MKKLKPCRCCGKTAGLYSIDVGGKLEYLVSCNNEDCEEFLLATDGEFDTPEEAVKTWNEREGLTMDYLREYGRMCETQTTCKSCPFQKVKINGITCQKFVYENSEKAAKLIEKWSKEHPQKTRLQDFLEKYPNAIIMENGEPQDCCMNLGYIKMCPGNCTECWNKPIDE